METFWVEANGIRLFSWKMGQGEPVILIHGACTDSDFFRDTAKVLSQQYLVCSYDRRGYGRSSEDDLSDQTVERQAEDLLAVVRQIGMPCHIIAHSGGTTIAMEFAARYPQLVRKIILHEPTDADCIEPGSEEEASLAQISDYIHRGKYNSAIAHFLPRLGERDQRARDATQGELERMGQNCMCFIKKEFEPMFRYAGNASALKYRDITVGVGEASQGTARWDVAVKLAGKLDADLLYYPGGHNCPYDLPREFAYLCCGVLNNQTKK